MNKEKVGALFLLLFSLGYGANAFQIPLIFLSQGETLNARTMPYALSITGVILSLLILILPSLETGEKASARAALSGLDWKTTGLLILLMTIYSVIMPWVGFVISSILFLAAGFWVLGERNKKLILAASIPLVIVLWAILDKVLGMYIAPGEIFYLIGLVQ